MAISDITFSKLDVDFVKKYLRIDEEYSEDDDEIQLFIDIGRSWIIEHTEMTAEELDQINFSTILLLKYVADFYNDRTMKGNVKFAIDPVIDMLLTKIRSYNLGSIPKQEDNSNAGEDITQDEDISQDNDKNQEGDTE